MSTTRRRGAIAVAVCITGCGGATTTPAGPSDASSSDSSTTSDASTPPPLSPPFGPLVSDCPATPPANASACTHPTLYCEYGDDWNPRCNTVAQCYTQGFWQLTPPSSDSKTCPTVAGVGPNCPSSRALATGACTVQPIVCAYPDGICACFENSGPGAADASVTYSWACAKPNAKCSAVRPRLGSACTQPGLECDYQACGTYGGDFLCDGGVWAEGNNINFCAGG